MKFVNRDGSTIAAEGKVGMSLLDLVVEKNLDIDGYGKNTRSVRTTLLEVAGRTLIAFLHSARWLNKGN